MSDKGAETGGPSKWIARYMPGVVAFSAYQRSWLPRDVAAGLSVAAVALPVGIAYADLAGVPAVYGMYAAIFPLLAYAFFGSSRQLMTGPDGATCIMVAAILAPLTSGSPDQYLAMVGLLTLMTAAFFLIGGFLRLGFIANFLSQPILAGFLNGVGLMIVIGQVKKLLGYEGTAGEVIPAVIEIFEMIGASNPATAILGLSLLVLMFGLKKFLPTVPSGLVVVVAGILAVWIFDLEAQGVALLGTVPSGLPSISLPFVDLDLIGDLLGGAAALALVSYTSGVLTCKSFARRNRYDVDPNQEMIAFGTCNLASGIFNGFAVTGADSRTAVNNATGGKSQLVGIVAAGAMLLVLFFLTDPLALMPICGLAAVIVVAGYGLLDIGALREFYAMSRREFMLSVGTTLGVLLLGVMPGVLIAVALSILWLLAVGSRPNDSELGRVPGMKGFHSTTEFPEARTMPGLLLYRFDSDLVFFNADYFRDRVRAAIARAAHPVEWVVVDVSSVNVTDATGVNKFTDLQEELAARGITLAIARPKGVLQRHFRTAWAQQQLDQFQANIFPTLRAAVKAFEARKAGDEGQKTED